MTDAGRLVAIGHSHCGCLTDASADGVRFTIISFWFTPNIVEQVEGKPRLNPAVASQLRAPVLSMMGGGAHTVLSLAPHPQPFDFILPERPDLPLDPDAEVIPFEVMRRRLLADAQEFLDLTELVRRNVRGAMYHVDTPPPVADADFIRPQVPWQYFPGRREDISPKWHRWKMWRINTELAREHAKRIGIGFIGHPTAAQDGEGFLDQRYCSDGIHGNEAYGDLLARRILDVTRDGKLQPGDFHPGGDR
jgi:hypothetical protein